MLHSLQSRYIKKNHSPCQSAIKDTGRAPAAWKNMRASARMDGSYSTRRSQNTDGCLEQSAREVESPSFFSLSKFQLFISYKPILLFSVLLLSKAIGLTGSWSRLLLRQRPTMKICRMLVWTPVTNKIKTRPLCPPDRRDDFHLVGLSKTKSMRALRRTEGVE